MHLDEPGGQCRFRRRRSACSGITRRSRKKRRNYLTVLGGLLSIPMLVAPQRTCYPLEDSDFYLSPKSDNVKLFIRKFK